MRISLDDVTASDGLVHCAVTLSGGARYQHSFPVDTLEWRAAEYDIPLDDPHTLLEVVLAEPHTIAGAVSADAVLTSADVLRERHLLCCGAVEVVPADADVWRRAVAHCVLDPVAHRLKRRLVQATRVQAATRASEDPAAARVDRLRALVRGVGADVGEED